MNKKLSAALLTILSFASLKTIAADYRTENTANNQSAMPMHRQIASRSEYAPHIGILAGVATPEGRYKSNGEYGLDFGYQPFAPIGTGVEVSHYEITNSTDNDTIRRTNVLGKVSYNFGGTVPVIRDSYVGLGLGPVFKEDGTGFATAPFLGFDIPLAAKADQTNFTLGANAKYIIVSGGDPDALSVNGVLKYWY